MERSGPAPSGHHGAAEGPGLIGPCPIQPHPHTGRPFIGSPTQKLVSVGRRQTKPTPSTPPPPCGSAPFVFLCSRAVFSVRVVLSLHGLSPKTQQAPPPKKQTLPLSNQWMSCDPPPLPFSHHLTPGGRSLRRPILHRCCTPPPPRKKKGKTEQRKRQQQKKRRADSVLQTPSGILRQLCIFLRTKSLDRTLLPMTPPPQPHTLPTHPPQSCRLMFGDLMHDAVAQVV